MESCRRLVRIIVCLGVGAFCATAATADEKEKPQPPNPSEKPAPGARGMDPAADALRFAEQLREAVNADLALDEEQEAEVSKLFDEYVAAVKAKAAQDRPDPADLEEQRERMQELERQARAAREAGDREQARKLLREARELRAAAMGPMAADVERMTHEFTQQVSEQLNDEQRPKFQELVRRFRQRRAPGGPLSDFMRAVRRASAELDLNRDERGAVQKSIRESVREGGGPMAGPEVIEKAMERLRTEAPEILGSQRAEQFLDALEKERQKLEAEQPAKPAPVEKPDAEDQPDPEEDEDE